MSARKKYRVLFLCTGNSARSQMAEGLVNHFLGDRWEARSAGSLPAGFVDALAIAVMSELGIDISSARSKSTKEFQRAEFDLVITLCDEACKACAVWLGRGERAHIGFPDPVGAQTVTLAEHRAVFRQTRDDIRRRVFDYLERWERGETRGQDATSEL
jgi:arsenate reductase